MSRRLPPLNSLRTFESAARHLSFTKASEELFVTQAAVSHQIKHLEEFLGLALFHRKNRKLTLTEEGIEYWPQIRDIFEQLKNATENIQSAGATGSLNVSVIPAFAIEWLIPRLDQFKALYPEIDVRITANNQGNEVDFFGEDIDVAIYFSKGRYRKGIYKQRLLDEYLIPLCSPRLLNSDKPLVEPEDLKNHTLLHQTSTEDWSRWLSKAGVSGINLTHGTVFSHTVMLLQAAIHGQGVAIGYSVLAQQEINSGRLITPFDITLSSINSYDFACPDGNQQKPKIAAFREWLQKTIDAESAGDRFRVGGRYIESD
ncbi:MAG: LysR family glycine cleavage system transcriptional activator [Enterobacterales bacterium]|jgi:LysR family glycine cleavage system transcriptional activator